MVNGVMTVSELQKVRKQMKLIQDQGNQFEWFVSDILSWYQTDLINSHMLHQNEEPPNIFGMKEYNFFSNIDVYAHFGKLRDSVEADDDVISILNVYHLFYCYRDDAHPRTRYYNHFSKEVW